MSDYSRLSCFLLGARSLLIQCGEKLIERGHLIKGVLSDDPEVVSWAERREIPASSIEYAAQAVAGESFDYLFSIVNLQVTPDAVINAPAIAAINF
ncbi:MAG: hypothetical protein R3208_16865, partial [Ketobacteraceae bacterium]|nr:hypothetical protein [Ketobacteraceae bacterium]